MTTIVQYPHFLFVAEAPEATRDNDGNFVESEASKTFISMCREETSGRGTEYQVAGGEYQVAQALIQCPTSCPVVNKGAYVYIANDESCNDIRIEGVVLNFVQNQLHTRLWL